MNKFVIFLSRCCLSLLLSFCLILGVADGFWPINPILSFAYAETLTADNNLFSKDQTRLYAEKIPYWIWLVLPRIFPEYLDNKGGYLSLGFQWQAGDETPTGIAKSNDIGWESLSCNSCHIGNSLAKKTSAVDSMITQKVKFNHQRYHQFLKSCAKDPRFTADYILPAIEYNHQLSFLEKQYYRISLIPKTRKQLLA
jgi:hypothetical protein